MVFDRSIEEPSLITTGSGERFEVISLKRDK
jgi:hypothetical protein